MTPEFDNHGMAVQPGTLRCFYYDPVTYEYTGWSDEYIYEGVSMPANSTDLVPGEESAGMATLYVDGKWQQVEDHRGETVYSTADASVSTIDYVGAVRDGFTTLQPSTPYDEWSGSEWVTNTANQKAGQVSEAENMKTTLINEANSVINTNNWPSKLTLGRLSDADKAKFNLWLDYIDEVTATSTADAPDIDFPAKPDTD